MWERGAYSNESNNIDDRSQQVVKEQTKQKAEEALILLEVQGTEALRAQKQKEGVSLAMLIEERNRAQAVRAKADVSVAPPSSVFVDRSLLLSTIRPRRHTVQAAGWLETVVRRMFCWSRGEIRKTAPLQEARQGDGRSPRDARFVGKGKGRKRNETKRNVLNRSETKVQYRNTKRKA